MKRMRERYARWLPATLVTIVSVSLAVGGPSTAEASPPGLPRQAGHVVPFVRAEGAIFAPTASGNFFSPNFPFGAEDFVLLPLAMQTPQTLSSYIPQVAKTWSWQGNDFLVHLRSLRWQDGEAVTARDVVDSEILNGVASAGVWDDIAGVSAVGARTVRFAVVSGVSHVSAMSTILATTVLPASQYGRFVTPGLEQTVAAYYKVLLKDPTAAASTPQGKSIAAADKKLLSYTPQPVIGDGPYVWKRWTTNDLYLVKSNTFYGARSVHVPVYEDEQVGPNLNGVVTDGGSDYTSSVIPASITEKSITIPGHHFVAPPSYTADGLQFNDHRYPLDITKVRQALAYLLHRPVMDTLLNDHLPEYSFVRYPSLLMTANATRYVPKQKLETLNPYPYDPKKASSLLESVGFHKVRGVWHLPSGKPFSLSLQVESSGGYAVALLAFRVFSSWLDAFGIKAEEEGLDSTTIESNILDGNYSVIYNGSGFYNVLDADPLEVMSSVIGSSSNFISKTETGLGFGPVMDVPGIGKVDVPVTIDKEAAGVGPGKQMDRLVWDWAKFINREVPVLEFGDRNYVLNYTTLHYTDWPAKSNALWKLDAVNTVAGIAAMIEDGYIRPRR